jgi:hypothetical protein
MGERVWRSPFDVPVACAVLLDPEAMPAAPVARKYSHFALRPNPTLLNFSIESGYILRVSTASPRVTFSMARFATLTCGSHGNKILPLSRLPGRRGTSPGAEGRADAPNVESTAWRVPITPVSGKRGSTQMKFQKLCFAVTVLATMIAIGPTSVACTNANVIGVWGYQVGAAVGQFTADGTGNITSGSQTVSQNGVIGTQTYTGTYSVATNCTGSLTINFNGGGTAHANFVLDNGKKGAQIIDTDSGTVAGGFGLVQGVVTCGLTGIKAIFAANLFGKIPNTGPIAYVAQVILDGSGKVSGRGTFDVNGAIVTAPITGTYTENADCTGTVKITPSGLSTLNFNFVVVNLGKEILLIETDANTIVAGNMQK